MESKEDIEQRLGKPCRLCTLLNGDYYEHSARKLQEAGYDLAFTTQPGLIRPASNRFLLPRLSPGGSAAKLKLQLRELGGQDGSRGG